MSKQKIFQELCYVKYLQETYNNYIKKRILNIQEFHKHTITQELLHLKYNPSNICISCKKEIMRCDFDIYSSYWSNLWFPIHIFCKKQYEDYNKYECQCIDCNCNDCKFFKRELNNNYGTCLKFFKRVNNVPNNCYLNNFDCFVHRLNE